MSSNKRKKRLPFFAAVGALALIAVVLIKPGKRDPSIFRAAVGQAAKPVLVKQWVLQAEAAEAARPGRLVRFERLKGKVVLFEHWATWCTPCVEKIPKLIELQKRHQGDLVILSLSNESLSTVEDFLKKRTLKSIKKDLPATPLISAVNYSVGIMDKSDPTISPYFGKIYGVPAFYVIGRDGTVQWASAGRYDHVLQEVERLLAGKTRSREDTLRAARLLEIEKESGVLEDEYEKLERMYEKGKAESTRLKLIEASKKSLRLADELTRIDPDSGNGLSDRIAALRQLWNYSQGRRREDLAREFKDTRLRKYHGLEGVENAEKTYNSIAWGMVTEPSYALRQPVPALEMMLKAERIFEKKDGTPGYVLDTLARAYHAAGDPERGLKVQERAVGKAEEKWKASLAASLGYYRQLSALRRGRRGPLKELETALAGAKEFGRATGGKELAAEEKSLKDLEKTYKKARKEDKDELARKTAEAILNNKQVLLGLDKANFGRFKSVVGFYKTLISRHSKGTKLERYGNLKSFYLRAYADSGGDSAFRLDLADFLLKVESYEQRHPVLALKVLEDLKAASGPEPSRRLELAAELEFQLGNPKRSLELLHEARGEVKDSDLAAEIDAAIEHHSRLIKHSIRMRPPAIGPLPKP